MEGNMTLKLQGSSSGHTALEAPASAGSNTIILPANNGTSGQYLKNTGTAGTLEFANLPVGSVLQQVHASTTTEITNATTTFASWTGLAANITPISSSSHLWVWVNAIRLQTYRNSNEARIRVTDGSNSTAEYRLRNYDSDDDYLPFNPCTNWYWTQTHTAGAQITVTPQIRNTDGSNNVMWGDNGSNSYMIVQEIAQ